MKVFAALIFLLTGISALSAQNDKQVMQDLRIDVVYLASDYLEGREAGTMGEKLAAEYIASRFEKMGLTPKGEENSFFQIFPWHEIVNPHVADPLSGKKGQGINVIAFLDNGAANTVVIGAHYDHLGMGGEGSLHAGEAAIHNGADDNASGIAVMLRLADYLKKGHAKSNNYLFIAFSAEEKGLFGSKYFVENPTIDLKQINFMLNLDMVGRLNEEKVLAIYGVGTSPVWKEILPEISVAGIQIKTTDSGIGPSDHTSFYLKDIPVLHFFTGQHMDYHKPGDDASLVNFTGLYEISDFIIALLEKGDKSGKLAFTKTKEEEERKVTKFEVSLGVMPDYVFNGQGMRIDGVLEGRVAQKAGLEKGDIVIKIGETQVKDIYSYMEGLSKFKKGDKTNVVVLRDGKELHKQVQF